MHALCCAKNVDVDDGLVNGACGIVTNMALRYASEFSTVVYVQFADQQTGSNRRRKLQWTH